MNNSPKRTEPSVDSAWLWIGIFLFGALAALLLAGPRYYGRQAQIERQFNARARSGQANLPVRRDLEPADSGSTRITLQPLIYLCAGLLLGLTALFWVRRWSQGHARARHAGRDRSGTEP